MLNLSYDYATCVKSSEKASWKLDDVMPMGTRLDFARPFLPERLARTSHLTWLDDRQRLALNHISSNAYLNLFGFVEEFILNMAVQHAQAEMFGNPDAIRALVRFADEELKHQALFKRYRAAFERDFGHPCDVLDNAADVAGVVLAKSPMSVVVLTLHIELMTQDHYIGSVQNDDRLDPFFAKLLKHHWMEEAQHARIDALELDALADASTPGVREKAVEDYLAIGGAFDGLLKAQAEMDVGSLSRATSRAFTADETSILIASQHSSYRHTFLVSGMRHPTFVEHTRLVFGEPGARSIAEVAQALS